MPRLPDHTLPKCPTHRGSSVRREGTYGEPPRPRLRCFYTGEDGKTHKHGLRPPPKSVGVWDELPGSHYGIEEVATALVDLARGTSYTETARRAQVNHGWDDLDGLHAAPEATAMSGATVAGWLDRFGPMIATEYAEREWPQSLVCDSTEFGWTNPRTGDKQQMFSVLAAWGHPAGAKRGRLWALAAAPSDDKEAWKAFFDRLPARPEVVVYDSDKAIHSAVRQKWPAVPIHLCEHHLYNNAKKHLRADGQEGWGNTYRTLLAAAGQSPEGWAAFRAAVLAEPTLVKTGKWVRFWDGQMIAQTARRSSMPPHYSTGALDPHIAAIRQQLERRRWTFRNLSRMNALLGLVRLHVNRRDVVSNWAKLLARAVTDEQAAWAATAGDRRKKRPRAELLNEAPHILPDGSRIYSLRKHPVPPRASG